jgi:uncharacterized membrane protein
MLVFDEMLWATLLIVILILAIRGARGSGPRARGEPTATRLEGLEAEVRDLKGQVRALLERVWYLEQGRVAGGSAELGGSGEPSSAGSSKGSVEATFEHPERMEPPPPAPRAPADGSLPYHQRMVLEQRIGGRWTTWVGTLAIVVALGFFLRWAFEGDLLGSVERILVGIGAGVVLLGGGQAIHRRRDLPFLSEALVGSGLGVLYLSLRAAHSFYGVISATATFYLMFLVTIAGAALAVTSNRAVTAGLALVGGLLTPVFLADGRPDERVLLGYLLVLDCLILAVARYRRWPALAHFAWGGTALLVWSMVLDRPGSSLVPIRLILLSMLFVLFLAVPILREPTERGWERRLDVVLVVLNAAAYFYAVQRTLEGWAPRDQGLYALTLAALYVLLAEACRNRIREDRALRVTHLGVSTVFLVLGSGLTLEGPWITLALAAQGVALLVLAPRVAPRFGTWAGAVVLVLAVARALWVDPSPALPAGRWNAVLVAHLLVVAALAVGGALAVRLRPGPGPAARVRDGLWIVGALLLAALIWRGLPGLWPAVLLSVELVVLGWLGRATGAKSFLITTPILAGVVLVRIFGPDSSLTRPDAGSLVSPVLAARLWACAAIGLAGSALALAGRGGTWLRVAQILSGTAGAALLVVLSTQWIEHQEMALRTARSALDWDAVAELRWKMQVGLSVLWTAFAAGSLVWGFVRDSPGVRYGALGLLGLVLVKVFLVDLEAVDTGYRIMSFLVLGLVLLGVSYLYQRARRQA